MMFRKLATAWRRARASYWFVPSVMVMASILLALGMSALDGQLERNWLRDFDFLFDTRPEGARAVLSAIASSMITVAGVTFSMTIVAVSFASAQFGPRLVGNFMRDTGNQVTLGVFIATFVYSLLILRTVRGAATGQGDAALESFVPHASILLAIAMAIGCVAVLIYFIHHIPETINVGNITTDIGHQLMRDISSRFPDVIGTGSGELPGSPTLDQLEDLFVDARPVRSEATGFIETVDREGLVTCAEAHEIVVRLEYRPGDFVVRGDTLLHTTPLEEEVEAAEVNDALLACFAFGRERTRTQNLLFLVDQLVEIMARALSPGVNDPFTAFSCMNWLRSGLVEMASRETSSGHHCDPAGRLRVIVQPLSFERFVATIFDQSLQYVSADRNAAMRMMTVLAEAALATPSSERREILMRCAAELVEAGEAQLPVKRDRDALRARHGEMRAALTSPAAEIRLRDDPGWLGGSA